MDPSGPPSVVAIFGPTGVGKTAVAVELAGLLRERGEDPVAVNCDSIQVYRGLEVLSGAADEEERERLEHRLLSFVGVDEEFSAGRYAELARAEIDGALAAGRRPLVVGGTGMYLRAALSELTLRPPVPEEVRTEVEAEIALHGAPGLHSRLPAEVRERIHPNDVKRVARATELLRAGRDPAPDHEGGGELWTASLRRPTVLIGLVREREELREAIAERVRAMAAAGANREAERAAEAGASRTAAAAVGFDELLRGDVEAAITAHRRFARRQMTWMRRMEGVRLVDRTGKDSAEAAREVLALLDREASSMPGG